MRAIDPEHADYNLPQTLLNSYLVKEVAVSCVVEGGHPSVSNTQPSEVYSRDYIFKFWMVCFLTLNLYRKESKLG